jgi:predicted dehydrogenase
LLASDVEAVAIATPVDTHFELAKACLEAGKHVLLAKPMTSTVAEAQALRDLASAEGLTLMVDHTFNYTSAVTRIKELVSSGELGELLYWDSVRVNLGLFQHDVNVLWDLAPHDVSIMDFVVDEPAYSVSATGVAHYDDNLEDVAYMTLRFGSKFIAHFHLNWLAPVKVRQTLIGGDKKMVVYDDMQASEKVRIYDKGIDIDTAREGVYKTLVQYRMGDMFAPHLANQEALAVEMEHFVDVIRDGATPIAGADAGVRVVAILEAAQKSIEMKGQEVIL